MVICRAICCNLLVDIIRHWKENAGGKLAMLEVCSHVIKECRVPVDDGSVLYQMRVIAYCDTYSANVYPPEASPRPRSIFKSLTVSHS
jgi:hypothetical protein